ncbi:hypothetical protein [uncultured Mediterranean phage uvDeep-CGR2-KM21-C345]|nr:hypothetical protein [uncultured Mediterranean phage uvDeep-CGR2-KM21-C345]
MIVYRISNYCEYNGGRILDVIVENKIITSYDYYEADPINDWDIPNPNKGENFKDYVSRCKELTSNDDNDFGEAQPITKVEM